MSKKRRITDFFHNADAQQPRLGSQNENEVSGTVFDEYRADASGEEGKNRADAAGEDGKKTKTNHFQEKWLKDYPWLNKNDKGEMLCQFCLDNKMENAFTSGCVNYRTSTLTRHLETKDHKLSVAAHTLKKAMEKSVTNLTSKEEKAIKSAIDCAYWLAKENIATDKYSSLLELMLKEGCTNVEHLDISKNASYKSHSIADELQQAVADTILSEIQEKLKKALFISIMTDESTDISVCGKLILYVRYVDENFDVQTHFLGNFDVSEKDASTITETLVTALNERDIPIQKVVCLGSDGASVMTGVKNGVAARLKKIAPYIVNIHCIAHRLALCTSQAATKLDMMQQYKTTLTNLFYYFKGSSVRSSRLAKIQEIFNEPKLKVREMHDIRWFSFYNVLEGLYKTYNSLLLYFDSTELSKDPKATNLRNCLLQFKFAAMTWMLMDIIPIVTQLNLLFQREQLDISVVKPAVANAISKLEFLQNNDGHYKREFFSLVSESDHLFGNFKLQHRGQQERSAQTTMKSFIENLIKNLNKRFPSDSLSIISSFECLAMRDLSFISKTELPKYGCEKLAVLIEHYGKEKGEPLTNPIIDAANTEHEYELLKQLVLQQMYPRDNFNVLWKIICQNHTELFPNLLKLANIALTLSVQTAVCERGFSAQNMIKTANRNRLSEAKLAVLMVIAINGPPVRLFDASNALQNFKAKKQRRIFHKNE